MSESSAMSEFRDEHCHTVYGSKRVNSVEFAMAGGGSHWWNLVAILENGRVYLQRRDKDGVHEMEGEMGIWVFGDGDGESVMVVGLGEVEEWMEKATRAGLECMLMDSEWFESLTL